MIPPLRMVVVAELDCSFVPASSTSCVMIKRSFCSLSAVLVADSSRTTGRYRFHQSGISGKVLSKPELRAYDKARRRALSSFGCHSPCSGGRS